MFVVRTTHRDALRAHLAERGISTSLHYPIAVHRQEAFADRFSAVRFPVAEELASTVLTLPLSHEHDDAEIDAVIDGVRQFFARG